jgi:hypothetical protein
VGKAALVGLPGVQNVTKGWKDFKEINTVTYDPEVVTSDEMVNELKKAGTYRGTAR